MPPLSDADCEWLIDPEGERRNEKRFSQRVQAFLDMDPSDGSMAGKVVFDGRERTVSRIKVLAWRVFSANIKPGKGHGKSIKHGLFWNTNDWTVNVPKTLETFKCVFRSMPIADSGASRSPIPVEGDHRFRSKPIAERMSL
jgi:hypothetical protein